MSIGALDRPTTPSCAARAAWTRRTPATGKARGPPRFCPSMMRSMTLCTFELRACCFSEHICRADAARIDQSLTPTAALLYISVILRKYEYIYTPMSASRRDARRLRKENRLTVGIGSESDDASPSVSDRTTIYSSDLSSTSRSTDGVHSYQHVGTTGTGSTVLL